MLKDQTKDKPNPSRQADTLTFLVKRDIKALLEEGKRLFDGGNVNQAIEIYEQAAEMDSKCALVYFNLGFAYHEMKDYLKAKQHYQKAIEVEPNCSLFLEHLGRLHFERGDYPSSVSIFQRAIEVGQVQPISFGLLGRAHFKSENYEKAAESLSRMLQVEANPSLVNVARYHLILSLLRLGNMFRSRVEAELLLKSDGCDHDILQNLGDEFSRYECISLAKHFFERLDTESGNSVLAKSTVEKIQNIEARIDEILPRLYESDEEKVLRSVHALLDVGHEKVARALLSLRQSESPLVRESCIEYMRKFGFAAAPQIIEMLNDPASFVREKASHYIADAQPVGVEDRLIGYINDESVVTRRNLATYFARVGTANSLKALAARLESDQDPEAKQSLRFAIDAINKRESRNPMANKADAEPTEPDVASRARHLPMGYGLLGIAGLALVAGVIWFLSVG